MRKQKGLKVFELMFIVAVVVTGVVLWASMMSDRDVSYGLSGLTEMRCIGGYKFAVGEGGQARQVMSENGHGVRCE